MSTRLSVGLAGVAVLVAAAALVVAVIALTEDTPAAPTKDEPGAYTKAVVEDAVSRYEQFRLEATINYYNDPANVDGDWYVFIANHDGYLIAHYDPDWVNRDPSVLIDSAGRPFGSELLGATEEGRWVDYFFDNPGSGEEGQKHAWAVEHDGLLFGSGWYEF